ncbi:MAG: chemotaxis protein CheW [Syntrophales bacterium]|nr:chemotaxis protein CheW [Syntrophales bacterium]MDD5231880.1 chemotaxis protein CheW [Syntrophales bacterium]MDD5531535.1 chemotaxis protein CheW [Syntrophales bacterium]HPL63823.1 chemotaxis protein CheW [Syntrophales bacterium]
MHSSEAVETTSVRAKDATREGKYLTFGLGGEEYGLEILKVKEIIGIMNITSVPQTPKYVKGVINLRGKVIPVIDLRLKFGMEHLEYNERTCIIVVDIESAGRSKVIMGIVVDSVSEVLNIKGEEIEATPTFGVSLNTNYILGMAKVKGTVKILLDIDKVLTTDVGMAEAISH